MPGADGGAEEGAPGQLSTAQETSYFYKEFIEVINRQNMSLKDVFSSKISSVKYVPLSVMPAYDMVQYDVYNSARGRPVFPRRCEGHVL